MRVHARAAAAAFATLVALPGGTAFGAVLPPRAGHRSRPSRPPRRKPPPRPPPPRRRARRRSRAQVALDAAKAAATAAAAPRPRRPTTRRTSPPPPPPRPRRPPRSRTTTPRPPLRHRRGRQDRRATQDNADREAASFAKLNNGTSTEGTHVAARRHGAAAGRQERQRRLRRPQPRPEPELRLPLSTPPTAAELTAYNAPGQEDCPAYNPSKCPGFSALNFLHYENLGYDVIVANGTPGLSIWSLKDPEHPKYIGQVTLDARPTRSGASRPGRDP